MSEYVQIEGKKYLYKSKYRDDDSLRKSFNRLANNIFDIDFERWYQEGYWGDGYIPYSLIDDNEIVSNVSASIMEFNFKGKKKLYIQQVLIFIH